MNAAFDAPFEDAGFDEGSPEGRGAPHNLEAEAGVLGSLLLFPERLDLIRGLLEAEDFYSEAYGAIFDSLVLMSDESKPIDNLTLGEELTRRSQFDMVGGAAGLVELTGAVPNSANLEYYAGIVRDKARLRRLIRAATGILDQAYTGATDSTALLDWSEAEILKVADRGSAHETVGLKVAVKEAMRQLEEMLERDDGSGITGLATEFHQIDQLMGGLHGSELIIVAARPSMGKSTFVLNLLNHIGVKQGIPCAMFTLEMSKENVAQNMLCAHCRMPGQKVRSGQLSDEQFSNLGLGAGALMEAPVFIDDTPSITLGELRGKCRRLKRSHDIQMVAIDYMQLMSGPAQRGGEANRQQEISSISRGLKALARELNIPVIALSQLNRSVEGRANHRPMLSDLRESGAIEQDADVVLLLHRPSYYNEGSDDGSDDNMAQIIIAKQRNGPTGDVELVFLREMLKFENPSAHRDGERYD